MKYRAIVADPPWRYESGCWQRQRSKAAAHYDTLPTDDICALPVPTILADDAYLFLWTTSRHVLTGAATQVAEAWGFRPLTTLVWDKPRMGLGFYVRNCHELVVFGVHGKPGPFKDKGLRSVFRADVQQHSCKPDELYQLVEKATDGPYIDLFARAAPEGWSIWGEGLLDGFGWGFNPEVWRDIS